MKRVVLSVLIAAVLIGCVYYFRTKFSLGALLDLRIQTVPYVLILFMVAVGFGQYAVKVVLASMNEKTTLKKLFPIIMITTAVNYTNPVKLGIPLRVFLFKKLLGIPYSTGTASMALMNILWLFPPVGISLMGAGTAFDSASETFLLKVFLVLGLFVVIFVVLRKADLPALFSFIRWKGRIFTRAIRFLSNFQTSFRETSWACILTVLVLISCRYIVIAIVSLLILRDFGCHVSIFQILYVQSVSFLVGLVSMIPMGLGSKDVSLVFLLSGIGVTEPVAVSLALVERIIWTLIPILLGTLSGGLIGIRYKDLKREMIALGKDAGK